MKYATWFRTDAMYDGLSVARGRGDLETAGSVVSRVVGRGPGRESDDHPVDTETSGDNR
ncbi:MAG: hypothetical protein J07HX64_00350 [halophilic archaeon J07HX64]|nr:MAG: hypothetical protein J07HX64_00350 [halophilic archaeon J07HX64]